MPARSLAFTTSLAALWVSLLAACPPPPGPGDEVALTDDRKDIEDADQGGEDTPGSFEADDSPPDTDVMVDPCPDGCDDDNPCTDDLCEPTGCRFVPNVRACDDGDPCTYNDRCNATICVGLALACDDRSACTRDACVDGACVHTPIDGPCDDNDACTVFDRCEDGVCAGTARVCPDATCARATCDARTGCGLESFEGPCDDGNACTTDDTCRAGTCAGQLTRCDDNNPCTDDYCDPSSGCVHRNNRASCDDGDTCTALDRCDGGLCVSGANTCCDDDASCESGDPCQEYRCVSGHCESSPTCDDDDACTFDRCDEGHCTYPPWSTLMTFTGARAVLDDFEAPHDAWTFTSDNTTVGWAPSTAWSTSGTTSLYLGDPDTTSYDFGATRAVATRDIIIPPGTFDLTIAVRSDLDDDGSCLYDALELALTSTLLGAERRTLGRICTSAQQTFRFPIGATSGGTFTLELVFDTVDDLRNDGAGLWLDDLALDGTPASCPESK